MAQGTSERDDCCRLGAIMTKPFAVGQTHKVNRGIGKPYKIHILAILDGHYVAFKWYGRHKQWWHYSIEHEDFLQMSIDRVERIEAAREKKEICPT